MSGPVHSHDDGSLERPSELLDGIASDAWQAYNAMQATKQRHFDLLQAIDLKKRNYNIDPTRDDKARLKHLLADHDEQVRRFTEASLELKNADSKAHNALFVYIGAISSAAQEAETTH